MKNTVSQVNTLYLPALVKLPLVASLLIEFYLFRNSKYILLAHKFNSTTMNGIRLILQIIAHLCILLSFCMIISAITIPKWWRLNVKMANKDHINADVGLWEFCGRFPGKLNEVRKLHLYFTCQYSISAQEFSKIS